MGWYALAGCLLAGSIFTAVTAGTSIALSALVGLTVTTVAAVLVARSAPVDGETSRSGAGLSAAAAVAGIAAVRVIDSGLVTHAVVCLALGILVGALWRRRSGADESA